LAARLGGKILFICSELVLEVDGAAGDLAGRVGAERGNRPGWFIGGFASDRRRILGLDGLWRRLAARLDRHWATFRFLGLGRKLLIQDVILGFALDALISTVRTVITAVSAGKDVIQALVMTFDGTRRKHGT
jgi:hypothetical protein